MRFPIWLLFAAVAYAAVLLAAYRDPDGQWPVVHTAVWLAIVVWTSVAGVSAESLSKRQRSQALLICLGAYLLLAISDSADLPHHWIARVVQPWQIPEWNMPQESAEWVARRQLLNLLVLPSALLCGLCAYFLVAWRQRRLKDSA